MVLELQNKWDELIGQSVPVSKLTTDLKWVELTNKLANLIIKNCNGSSLVLDIGAGDGSLYFLIKKICRLYAAIEPSGIMVKRFRSKVNNYICQGIGEDLPYQSGIFDLAILNSALEPCDHDSLPPARQRASETPRHPLRGRQTAHGAVHDADRV